MSEVNVRLTFLFLIFDNPYLRKFGIFSIPLSIIFFQVQDLLLWSPCLSLEFPANPFLVCALGNFLYIFLFFSPSYVSVYLPEQTYFFFPGLYQGALLEKFKENNLRKVDFLKLLTKENLLGCFH